MISSLLLQGARIGRGILKSGFAAFGILSSALAQDSTVIAVSGDAPQGFGETLFEIDSSFLSNSGAVYFQGTLRENGQFKNSGLFVGDGDRSKISALILSGDPTPDSNGNVSGLGSSNYQANGSDEVVALVSLIETLAGNGDNSGIYVPGEANRTLIQVARKGEMIPDGEGGTLTRTPLNFSLNDASQLALTSSVLNSAAGFFGNAIHLFDNGSETEIFRSGRRTPADDGSFQTLSPAGFPQLNENGQVVVNVGISPDDPSGSRSGIFVVDGSGITSVAREGQAVPNGDGTLNAIAVTAPVIGNGGHVAFWSQLRNTAGGSVDNTAIFRFDGTSLSEIARRSELLPDGNGRYLNLFTLVDVNQAGEVLFQSTITGASGGSDEGIFVGNGSSTRIVVRVGDPAPEGGTLGDLVEESIRFNDQGQIFFAAILKFASPTEPVGSVGLFLHDPTLGLLEIAREQENFEGLGLVTQLIPTLRDQVSDPARGSLNANGQVAYRAFIGGDAVVIRWTPPLGAGPLLVPTPTIALSGDDLILSWPQTDFSVALESTTDLPNETRWRARPAIIPVLNGSRFEATVPISEQREFFRLGRSN